MDKIKREKIIFTFLILFLVLYAIRYTLYATLAQQSHELELTLDVNADTIPLPKIFRPNMDLSGRGFHRDVTWPQNIAAKEAMDIWRKDIGFSGFYRLQYNLWEIHERGKDKDAQDKLLANYEEMIKNITDAGGVVILDIFGTPAGLGKVLDKKSPPWDLKAFKELVKGVIRDLSCKKKYNIWYEVWNAPDLDDFFLGRKQEYFNLYRVIAQAVKELESETKMHIPLGGPSTAAWFQNLDGNTILTPERGLIYELIKFCYQNHLPLDFITWHSYSTDPSMEKEITIYKKPVVKLIRDWLSYFHFARNTPLIIDEWNFDLDANVLAERQEKSFISASYIPARLKNMYLAGIDQQLYFCLEDFQNNKEGVVRNVGVFSFDAERSEYKGSPKASYNVFRMLGNLGNRMYLADFKDESVGIIASKKDTGIVVLLYNYIDPQIVTNYLSKNIAELSAAERKFLLKLIKSDKLAKLAQRQTDVAALRTTNKVKTLLKKAQELNSRAQEAGSLPRTIKLKIKGLKENYLYQRYVVDSNCGMNCEFKPLEEKEVAAQEPYQEIFALSPYSVQMIVLKIKPKEPPKEPEAAPQSSAQPLTQGAVSQDTDKKE